MSKQDCIPKKDADFLTQLKFLRDKAPAQKTVTLRGDVPAGAFPLLAGGILNRLPAGDRKARADGCRSAPSLPKPGRPPACRVALPRHTAGANGEDGKRVAAFFILKCGLATRANGRKPAGDESKPQPIKKKYGARECYDH